MQVNILEAKTEFSKLIRLLESNREESIVVARSGKPVAEIRKYQDKPVSKRIGVAKGKIKIPEDFDRDNEEIAELLTGGKI